MKRSELREAVFKYLFMAEFNSEEAMAEQIDNYFEGVGAKDDVPEAKQPSQEDKKAIETKYENIKAKLPQIDALLEETSVGWKIKRMGKVDVSLLRLAVYEMLFDEDVPVGVAINEAVELAKRYGGEESGSFVNGILGKIAKKENA